MANTIIMGVDPGSRFTGYGIISYDGFTPRYITSGCINTGSGPLYQKLNNIFIALSSIMEQYNPQEFAIEETFLSKNVQSTVKLSQSRGAAIVAATTHKMKVYEYTALQIKKTVVGYGVASKDQIGYMVSKILSLSGSLQTDAADALACALTHAYTSDMAKILAIDNTNQSFVHGRYRQRKR